MAGSAIRQAGYQLAVWASSALYILARVSDTVRHTITDRARDGGEGVDEEDAPLLLR